MIYGELNTQQLNIEFEATKLALNELKAKGLKLDMSRGKPGLEQLALSMPMLNMEFDEKDCFVDGNDLRNYGVVEGLPDCKALFAEILGVPPAQVLIGGNASLTLMYDLISKAHTHGLLSSPTPWAKLPRTKFLCPSPGYDRHFRVTQTFGMELLLVPMNEDGPDMDVVEALVKDPEVKGMWCVPKYSNPTGCIYSDNVVNRIAELRPAAQDFLLMWDNAYFIHEFDGPFVPFLDIISLCEKAGGIKEVYEFCSTSKVTFAGAGVSAMASTEQNIKYMSKLWFEQTIGFDKVNQQRHVRFLKDKKTTLELMQKHAALLKPRFDAVTQMLEREIAPLAIADWTKPKGGYFISLNTLPGCAKRTIALCKEAGVVLTGAGAAFPYGVDPEDKNIRIAPTLPPLEELVEATKVLCVCIRLATLEKMLQK